MDQHRSNSSAQKKINVNGTVDSSRNHCNRNWMRRSFDIHAKELSYQVSEFRIGQKGGENICKNDYIGKSSHYNHKAISDRNLARYSGFVEESQSDVKENSNMLLKLGNQLSIDISQIDKNSQTNKFRSKADMENQIVIKDSCQQQKKKGYLKKSADRVNTLIYLKRSRKQSYEGCLVNPLNRKLSLDYNQYQTPLHVQNSKQLSSNKSILDKQFGFTLDFSKTKSNSQIQELISQRQYSNRQNESVEKKKNSFECRNKQSLFGMYKRNMSQMKF